MRNPAYEQLDNETTKMINCFTGANIKINKGKGVSNVCLAIQQMLEEEKQKGKQEGKREALAILIRRLKKFCPDFETLYQEIIQEKQYCHMTREQIKQFY